MVSYSVYVEAMGYGDVWAESEALEARLADLGEPGLARVMGDEDRGMLRVELTVEALDAVDASEQARDLWRDCWEDAFPEQALPVRFAVTAVPASEREGAPT